MAHIVMNEIEKVILILYQGLSVEHGARSRSAGRKRKQHPSRCFFSYKEVHHTGLGRPLL